MTLADLKRTIREGQTWKVTNHVAPDGNPLAGTHRRQVTTVNTVGFTLSWPGVPDRESHVQWPRAREVQMQGDGSICINTPGSPGRPYLTLTPVREGSS